MSVLDLFKPAAHQDEIQDPELVKKNYRYWRFRTFYAMWAGYAFFYFTRKSFTYAMPMMQAELGLGKFELGLLGSVLYITYGASKFLSGILGDRSNPRFFMSIGLILTGIFNIFFGLSSSLYFLAVFWGLNGIFQGWGWPGCAKLLTHWYSQSERGRWWSAWNTSHNVGGSVIPLIVAICVQHYGWRYGMYAPGVIAIVAGLFVMNRLRDTPQSLGLPCVEKFRNEEAVPSEKEKRDASMSSKELLLEYVIKNRFIWLLAVAYFLIYIIRTALNDWSMVYLIEVKGYSMRQAGVCLFWFEWGGFLGSLAAGWASDVLFSGRRSPINILFTLATLFVLAAFRLLDYSSTFLDSIYIFLFGFFIFGPQMLIGVAAAELSHKNATATATGFVGCFAYLGAAFAGGPLGALTQRFGWDMYLLALFGCGLAGAVVMLPLWSVRENARSEPVRT